MSWSRSWALARHEVKALRDDPGSIVFLLVMPLLMMALMKPLFELSLAAEGYPGANGAEQAVPGMAAMFTTFTAGFAGFTFFREHGWRTWDRLRASRASTLDVMIGKLAPTLAISVAQMLVLFLAGWLILDLHVAGSVVALGALVVAFSMCMLSFGVAAFALSRTSLQLNTFVNLFAIVFAGVGGALVPLSVLPGWVQSVAPAVPTYWVMEGFRGVILDGVGGETVVRQCAALLLFTIAFTGLAAQRFRFEESKQYVA